MQHKEAILKLTKHLILASRKLHEEPAEEQAEEPVLIKREFPIFRFKLPAPQAPAPIHAPAQIQIQKPEQKIPEKREEVFELGKITKFTMDKMIDFIECPGPDMPLKIKKENYSFLTDMKLSEPEIKDIIEIFSKEAKVPLSPVFKAEARGFSMMAIISSSGSRFLIRRLT